MLLNLGLLLRAVFISLLMLLAWLAENSNIDLSSGWNLKICPFIFILLYIYFWFSQLSAGSLIWKPPELHNRMVDWSSLPVELLGLIAKQLRFAQDYVRFGAVCKSWRWVILQRDGSLCSLLPLLMLAEKEFNDLREFCCPFIDRMFKLYLPEIRGKRCWGSSDGWLVTIGSDFQMCLLNPLTRKQILLPPLHKCSNLNTLICSPEEFRDYFVCKVVWLQVLHLQVV